MPSPRITVVLGTRTVSLEQVQDARIASALKTAGQQVARRIDAVLCPVHNKPATNVRIHFDARGNADLRYDSCCEQLGNRIGQALG
jgi:hypothetical protein